MRGLVNTAVIALTLAAGGTAGVARALYIKNSDFEMTPYWKFGGEPKTKAGVDVVAAAYLGSCGYGDVGRGGRVGRTETLIGNVNGHPDGKITQWFNCKKSNCKKDSYCVVTFLAKYTAGVGVNALEKARVGFAARRNGKLRPKTKIIPPSTDFGLYEISLLGCAEKSVIFFGILDDPDDPDVPNDPGVGEIGSTLCIDNVTSKCKDGYVQIGGGLTAAESNEEFDKDDLILGPCTGNGFIDCNKNEILDGDDLAVGTSVDSNMNGIPDDCEDEDEDDPIGSCCTCSGT